MSKRLLLLSFATILSLPLFSENFKFTYTIDEKYRIMSNVIEEVYINDKYSHRANILNKISVHVKDVKNNKGLLDANFITSETTSETDEVYEFSTEYNSIFYRDEKGRCDISSEYFMPVVRNVPVFPDKEIFPGDSWSEKGEEVHDFRKSFGIPEPYKIPIYVYYNYLGKDDYNGQTYDLISIRYNSYYKPPAKNYFSDIYPVKIEGKSEQLLYWNKKSGRPQYYEEDFEFIFKLSTGDTIKYKGRSTAYVIESEAMNKKNVANDIEKKLLKEGIKDTGVFESEEGVKIILSNIQFTPNSSLILKTEKTKLDLIAKILEDYPKRDVLIKGHTALAGTKDGRLELSKLRAKAVADYLLKKGHHNPSEIIVKGVGAEEPIADNTSAEGMKKNRRVEIIILEN